MCLHKIVFDRRSERALEKTNCKVANRQRRIDREHDRDSALTRVYAVEKEEGARRRTETERQRQKERAVCGIGEDFFSEDFFFEDSEKSSHFRLLMSTDIQRLHCASRDSTLIL